MDHLPALFRCRIVVAMNIPLYPDFAPLSIEMRDIIHPVFRTLPDGISEFTFANLYLFRETYRYRISQTGDLTCVISGEKEGKRFFMFSCGFPPMDIFENLMRDHDYVKCIPESIADANRIELEKRGFTIQEDRDNFDYLYLRKELAELEGKKFHKKRNLVNAFINNYTYEERPLTRERIDAAFSILEKWRTEKGTDGDYAASREAIERMEELALCGYLYTVDGTPAGYTLGEELMKGKCFAIHFEKALEGYKGIYQFINQSFASILPAKYMYINREQDLGDPGLRQAKLSYRPCGFVKKYIVSGSLWGKR